ncbi:uncharacterized protein LOC110039061 [Phalaenopsis equestris]|uniref:uncharacterized protein LOC110039061 n=1 Tax=Phalaenopsis equestris TaxID=78828 RepID=UPI0009E56617|nr:uncharacterized protein LOC110039061 [Phalaenopsis equestris]
MIITGDDNNGIVELKLQLPQHFEMKDLGTLLYFLGIEVAHSPRGHLLSDSKYIDTILEQARLSDTRTIVTPRERNAHYASSDGVPLPDPTLYHTLVGNLVYLTITRPDLPYAVHFVSQFIASPTTVHGSCSSHSSSSSGHSISKSYLLCIFFLGITCLLRC